MLFRSAAWLRLPVIGALSRGYNAAQCARTLALLIGAGVPMLKALQTAADTLPNTALRADLVEAQSLVREGAPLGKALAHRQRLPSLLAMFARLGEQTGELPHMLQRAAQQLSNEVQRKALYWATLLEYFPAIYKRISLDITRSCSLPLISNRIVSGT